MLNKKINLFTIHYKYQMNKNYDFELDKQFIVYICPNLECLMKIPTNLEI